MPPLDAPLQQRAAAAIATARRLSSARLLARLAELRELTASALSASSPTARYAVLSAALRLSSTASDARRRRLTLAAARAPAAAAAPAHLDSAAGDGIGDGDCDRDGADGAAVMVRMDRALVARTRDLRELRELREVGVDDSTGGEKREEKLRGDGGKTQDGRDEVWARCSCGAARAREEDREDVTQGSRLSPPPELRASPSGSDSAGRSRSRSQSPSTEGMVDGEGSRGDVGPYQRRTFYRSRGIDERRAPVAPWEAAPAPAQASSAMSGGVKAAGGGGGGGGGGGDGGGGSGCAAAPVAHVGYGMFRVEARTRLPAEPLVRRAVKGLGEDGTKDREKGTWGVKGQRGETEKAGEMRRKFFEADKEALQSVRLGGNVFEIGVDGRIRQQRKVAVGI